MLTSTDGLDTSSSLSSPFRPLRFFFPLPFLPLLFLLGLGSSGGREGGRGGGQGREGREGGRAGEGGGAVNLAGELIEVTPTLNIASIA